MLIEKNEFGQVSQVPEQGQVSQLVIEHNNCKASVSLYGGHVLSWQPIGHSEVLWLSNTSKMDGSAPIRGGIPLCWPWFGPLEGHTSHGFARRSTWQLANVAIDENGVAVTLELNNALTDYDWPHSFKVLQTLYFSKSLKQSLNIENLGDEAFEFSSALHSYFTVSHPENVTVPALNNARFDDKITTTLNCPAEALANCVGPIDRIYYQAEQASLIDSGLKRMIKIDKTANQQWVLWNPGKDIAAGMADVHPQGELEYVCLEAANTDFIKVPGKASFELSQHIQVESL